MLGQTRRQHCGHRVYCSCGLEQYDTLVTLLQPSNKPQYDPCVWSQWNIFSQLSNQQSEEQGVPTG